MTVQELIEQLKTLPPDAEVGAIDPEIGAVMEFSVIYDQVKTTPGGYFIPSQESDRMMALIHIGSAK